MYLIDINVSAVIDDYSSLRFQDIRKPEDHWSCIAHLSAEDTLKSAVIE